LYQFKVSDPFFRRHLGYLIIIFVISSALVCSPLQIDSPYSPRMSSCHPQSVKIIRDLTSPTAPLPK
jgi:hypothetical protein